MTNTPVVPTGTVIDVNETIQANAQQIKILNKVWSRGWAPWFSIEFQRDVIKSFGLRFFIEKIWEWTTLRTVSLSQGNNGPLARQEIRPVLLEDLNDYTIIWVPNGLIGRFFMISRIVGTEGNHPQIGGLISNGGIINELREDFYPMPIKPAFSRSSGIIRMHKRFNLGWYNIMQVLSLIPKSLFALFFIGPVAILILTLIIMLGQQATFGLALQSGLQNAFTMLKISGISWVVAGVMSLPLWVIEILTIVGILIAIF